MSYAIRFRALGRRQYVTLGHGSDGWTRRRAEDELAAHLADVRRGVWQAPTAAADAIGPKAVPTFHEFASEWFERQRLEGGRRGTGLTAKGAADLEWRLTKHLLPHFARMRLDTITIEAVDAYRAAKVRQARERAAAVDDWRGRCAHLRPGETPPPRPPRPLSVTSINKTIVALGAILEVAVEYELIARNPAKGRRRKLPAVTPTRTWLARADHIEALLAGAGVLDASTRVKHGKARPLLATLTFAGLRIGEALSLRWADVDLARGTLSVRQSKTDAGVRVVNMRPALRDELLAYRAGWGDVDRRALVFGTSTGRRESQSNVSQRILAPAVGHANAALEADGIEPLPVGLTPHSLRRTFVSLLFVLGESPVYAMDQMGHTSAAMTLGVYAQMMSRRDGESERLRALVDGASGQGSGSNAAGGGFDEMLAASSSAVKSAR